MTSEIHRESEAQTSDETLTSPTPMGTDAGDSADGYINFIVAVMFGIALFTVTLTAVSLAWNFRGPSRVAPLMVGIPMLAFLVVQIQSDVRRLLVAKSHFAPDRPSAPSRKTEAEAVTATTERHLLMWFTMLSMLVVFAGFYVAILVFTAVFLRIAGKHSLRLSVLHALLSVVTFYILMELIFRMRVFNGLFFM